VKGDRLKVFSPVADDRSAKREIYLRFFCVFCAFLRLFIVCGVADTPSEIEFLGSLDIKAGCRTPVRVHPNRNRKDPVIGIRFFGSTS
jgi:hypothetical protein